MLIYILGFLFISILGTLLHFTYDISKHNKIIALFSAVNESTWEHIKLVLTPIFIWSLVDGYILGSSPSYFFAKAVSTLVTIVFIPLVFYLYTSITKRPILAVDISSFYISILINEYIMYKLINTAQVSYLVNYISIVLFIIIFGFYMVFTLFPLESPIFLDPITKKYGLEGHGHGYKKNNRK